MKAVPWITVLVLALMLYMLAGTLTRSEGVLFELPEKGLGDAAETRLVAVMFPQRHDTLVFFDDVRYVLGDSAQNGRLGEQLAEGMRKTGSKTLLILADARVPVGDMMQFASIARANGIEKLFFANKRGEAGK